MKIVILFVLVALTAASAARLVPIQILNPLESAPIPDTNLEGRITNGQTATKGQFPYVVNLNIRVPGTENVVYLCGGSLIGHEWVVTAAHCIDGQGDIFVHLGGTNPYNREVSYTVANSNAILHPDWKPSNTHNDLALIKIPYTEYSTYIQPIQLPAYSSALQNYNGQSAQIFGWGGMASGSLASDLQYASVSVLSQETCGQSLDLIDSMLCITSVPSSLCGGDSGGPVVYNGRLIGVASFVVGSCSSGYPSGSTRLTSFVWFIKKKTGIVY